MKTLFLCLSYGSKMLCAACNGPPLSGSRTVDLLLFNTNEFFNGVVCLVVDLWQRNSCWWNVVPLTHATLDPRHYRRGNGGSPSPFSRWETCSLQKQNYSAWKNGSLMTLAVVLYPSMLFSQYRIFQYPTTCNTSKIFNFYVHFKEKCT